jgi:hypothetical protein
VAAAIAWAGVYTSRDVLNPATVIVKAPDIAATAWIERYTPTSARFLVSTAPWHLGTYRGLDGGYWLPVLAHRQASIPAALYPYGDPGDVREITASAERASMGDAMSDVELDALMTRIGADYVYVGPASAGIAGALSAERLGRDPQLDEIYSQGGAHVFIRARPGEAPDADVVSGG